jgi:SAM-dependent methyltransferase
MPSTTHPASYRDPAGHVFLLEGVVYRQVNESYREDYTKLMDSGLYAELIRNGRLVGHEEVDTPGSDNGAWKVIRPHVVDPITYPYEWSFSQLREAAILTLDIQKEAMRMGMSLKDATPFNVAFEKDGSAIFIDTLSFENYVPQDPWVAYHQFCTGFLAPLLLAAKRDPDLIRLLALHPDGIPLDICADLLPRSTRFQTLSALHIHLPAKVKPGKGPQKPIIFSKDKLLRIIDHLRAGITSLNSEGTSTWSEYYGGSILGGGYLEAKKQAVAAILSGEEIYTVFDAGCNTGEFSLLLATEGKRVIAADVDAQSIDHLARKLSEAKKRGSPLSILPVVVDLMNPPPAIGWGNAERPAFLDRIQVDLTLALALVHHLALGKNLPFPMMAETFSRLSPWLLIEFVPKHDPKAQELLKHKKDIYADYDEAHFLSAFAEHYVLVERMSIAGSERMLFLFRRNS